MASWSKWRESAEPMATFGRDLLWRTGAGEGLLTTVAGAGLPRTHPVNVAIVDDRLMMFVQPTSSKARDLSSDGRYALHSHFDPQSPHELLLRGRAIAVSDERVRARAIDIWPFEAGDDYLLFELDIEHVLVGERQSPDDWPPQYTSWRPNPPAAGERAG
jgi:hypothetical protein